MSKLKANLALLQQKRAKNSGSRRRIMDTIVEISQARTAAAADMSAAAGRKLAPNPVAGGTHSMGDGHNHTSQSQVTGLNAQFKSQLDQLISASGGKIKVGSGYRSNAQQQVLYDRYKRGVKGQAPAAKPGSSNHNFGLAADLTYGTGGKAFAHANAAKYGLVFPMSYEPWHIEPTNAKSKR